MILEIITCEKPERRHVFIGFEKTDLWMNEHGEWVVNVYSNGVKERIFHSHSYRTWYEEFAEAKLCLHSVHTKNIFRKNGKCDN
ncbi:MAG: hypothetical protein ACYTFW_21420 [Planctomycetota bacterium]|jgi:hypothetical protein